jgi:hypothetical protein
VLSSRYHCEQSTHRYSYDCGMRSGKGAAEKDVSILLLWCSACLVQAVFQKTGAWGKAEGCGQIAEVAAHPIKMRLCRHDVLATPCGIFGRQAGAVGDAFR